jgi:hypothetical protein
MERNETKEVLSQILRVYHPEKIVWEPLESQKAKGALERALELSSSWTAHGVSIDAGTLLGAIRDGNFIKHDSDIDIAILTDRKNMCQFVQPSVEISRSVYLGELPMQIAYLDNGILVDFYFYYLNSEGDYYVNANSECVLKLPQALFFPIQQTNYEFLGRVPIPSKSSEYLEWTYGEEWRIPKTKKSKWVNDRQHLGNLTDLKNCILDEIEYQSILKFNETKEAVQFESHKSTETLSSRTNSFNWRRIFRAKGILGGLEDLIFRHK